MDNQTAPTAPSIQNATIQSAQPSPPAEQKPPRPFFLNKIFLAIIVLMILLIGGGTYLVLNSQNKPSPTVSKITPTSTPPLTPDPTANWKVYANSEYGYSIKYPQDWQIVEDKDADRITFSEPTESDIMTNKPALVSIYVVDKKDFSQTWIDSYTPYSYKTFEKDEKIFVLIASTYQEGAEASEETQKLAKDILTKMASTFKFTDGNMSNQLLGQVYWDVPSGSIPISALKEIKSAFTSFDPKINDGQRLAVIGIEISSISATFGSAEMQARNQNNEIIPTDGFEYLLSKTGNYWQITTNADSNFCNVLKSMPEDILKGRRDYYIDCFPKN